MKPHVLNVYPPATDAELRAIAEDIRTNGQLEPVAVWEGDLLDGHTRWLACQMAGVEPWTIELEFPSTAEGSADARRFTITKNEMRKHLSVDQRTGVAARMATRAPGRPKSGESAGLSQAESAKALDVPGGARALREFNMIDKADRALGDRVIAGRVKISVARQRLDAKNKHAEEKKVRAAAAHKLPEWAVYDCSCLELIEHVAAGTVDVIITDPPYPRELIHTWSELSAFAAHALKPGGLVFAMSGQVALPEVHDRMREHLTYHHEIACRLPGATLPIRYRCANVMWKPVVVYSKQPAAKTRMVGSDFFESEHEGVGLIHKWGQSPAAAQWLIDKCTKPEDFVADPFIGSGLFGVKATQAGRRFIGCDNGVNDDLEDGEPRYPERFGDRWAAIARDEIAGN